ncbi:MAG: DUF4368 domain-containing protein [Clostridiales bacterium]|jgi:DNA invertase Pin-like site-specific DNA recombinase|nr:DUF4368 domain-containing protein [Clostridiales bacterium]
MKQPNSNTSSGIAAPYQHIPDYKAGLDLPDAISVLYTRLSNEDKRKAKEDDSDSIQNQKKILAKFALDNHLVGPIFFTDDDYTGTNFDRPDFQAAMELAEAGRVRNFIVKDMSRFGRDHIRVGLYKEMLTDELNVRFVAINDDEDSKYGENEMTPFRNIVNEWYARDTSKKIKAVFRAKGMAGENICSVLPYGYRKNSETGKWEIDEVAAQVVRQIFQYCLEGLGPTHIANKLQAARVEMPIVYAHNTGQRTYGRLPDNPYGWEDSTIVRILARREYLGHTVNFKTYRKTYKSKKKLDNDPSEYVIFENTHPAIIEEDVFERVQQIRTGKRRNNRSGRVSIFSGLVFCADCGSKMYLSSGESLSSNQDNYTCSGFRTKKRKCDSSHFIRQVVLGKLVLKQIQAITAIASEHKEAFANMLQRDSAENLRKEISAGNKRLLLSQNRIRELDIIIQRLYEDNVSGKITDERFIKLSQGYEQEQKDLQSQVGVLQKQLTIQQEERLNVDRFLAQVCKHSNVTELSATLLNKLVKRIEVHARDKSNGEKQQRVHIHYNYVGDISKLVLEPYPPPDVIQNKIAEME